MGAHDAVPKCVGNMFCCELDHDYCFLMTLSNVSCAFAGPAGTGGVKGSLF